MKLFKSLILLVITSIPFVSHAQEAYKLNPGDILNISVWNEEALQQDVLVLPDGTFVSTTYCVPVPGDSPLVVSLRFTLAEIDARARGAQSGANQP